MIVSGSRWLLVVPGGLGVVKVLLGSYGGITGGSGFGCLESGFKVAISDCRWF